MKLNFLPQFILNASARKFAFNYFKNIIKLNKNFANSKWEEKVKENADFYMFFKKKVDEYLSWIVCIAKYIIIQMMYKWIYQQSFFFVST